MDIDRSPKSNCWVQLMDHLGPPIRELNLALSPLLKPIIAFPRCDVEIWVNRSMEEPGS